MTTVKLDLISAKAQQASGKSSGKSERANNSLFTEVFSSKLNGSRTTTAADDKSPSSAKDTIVSPDVGTEHADYEDSMTVDKVQDDTQKFAENEDDSIEKAVAMPAWLMMQLEQSGAGAEFDNMPNHEVVAAASDINPAINNEAIVDLSLINSTQASGVEEIAVDLTAMTNMIDGENEALLTAEVQIPLEANDLLQQASVTINETGKQIFNTGLLPQDIEAVLAEQQNEAAQPAVTILDKNPDVAIGMSEEIIVLQQKLNTSEEARPNIQETTNDDADIETTAVSDKDNSLNSSLLDSVRLGKLRSSGDSNKQTGQENDSDNNGSAFAQMIRSEAGRQGISASDNTNATTGMYAAEVEVRDVGQFGRQLIERIDLRQLDQSQQLTIRLRPDEFGSLTIRLTRSPQGLLAQLISDTAVTREMLAQQANDLQQALKDQGFDIVQTEILSDFADQQQTNKSFDSWQQLQEGREINIRTANAAARLSDQMLEQDESQQIVERYTTGSVDYFA